MSEGESKAAIEHGDASRVAGIATASLADFVVSSRWDSIPLAVRNEARRSIFNGFGTALGGIADEAALRMLDAVVPFSGPPQASIIGHRTQVDLLTAAS